MKKILIVLLTLVLTVGLAIPLAAPAMAVPVSSTIDLAVTYRDFHGMGWGNPGPDNYYAHPDFEDGISDDHGIVSATLGADKKPIYVGGAGTSTTHGQTYFDQWYRDTANVNMAKSDTLTFTLVGPNYVYNNSAFFPLDGQLLRNDGRNHNFHFTMELHSTFTYKADQVFSFTGDDDVWVFINDSRVIDLGGVHGAESASINLNTLGLTPGQTYSFDLFFAERHTTESTFHAETNIVLVPPTPPPTPTEVGGDVYPANKLLILTPWLVLAIVIAVGTTILIRRRQHQS